MWLFTDPIVSHLEEVLYGNIVPVCNENSMTYPQLSTFSGEPRLPGLRLSSRGSPTWTRLRQSQVRDAWKVLSNNSVSGLV